MISLVDVEKTLGVLVGTPRCGVTARIAGGIPPGGTVVHPTTHIAPLNAARTAQRAVPAKYDGEGALPK